jgi:hypothetical protein
MEDVTMRSLVGGTLLLLLVGVGAASAQNPPPPAPPPAATQPAAAPQADADKKAIAKSCTDQANAKGLHGKARKKFRSACKKAGGNPPPQ